MIEIGKRVEACLDAKENSPLSAYVEEIKKNIIDNEAATDASKIKANNITINQIFLFDNKLAGVVNDAYLESLGYAMWYFYNKDGKWISMGEDIGGSTIIESEITFMEKAQLIINAAKNKK